MTDKIISTTIEILGKLYPIRCPESELKALQEAAQFLGNKMFEVQESGKAINLERIAIITALNITSEYLRSTQQKEGVINKINQRITHMQDKIDNALNQSRQTELLYTAD